MPPTSKPEAYLLDLALSIQSIHATNDGALLWEKTYKESSSVSNFASANNLALGPHGRVAITSSSNLGTTFASDILTVVYRENLPPVAIELAPVGVRLRFAGIPGRAYTIERQF